MKRISHIILGALLFLVLLFFWDMYGFNRGVMEGEESKEEFGNVLTWDLKKLRKVQVFYDFDKGMEHALSCDKDIFLAFEFLGSSNSNTHDFIQSRAIDSEEFAVVILYADKVGEEGKINRALQLNLTGGSTQPQYVLLNHEEEIIGGPLGYGSQESMRDLLKMEK